MRFYLGDKEIKFLSSVTAVDMGEAVTDGEYDKDTNKLATQSTVKAAVNDAKAEIENSLSSHNVDEASHSDMRLLISELMNRLNALANSEDIDLDQMAELVAYIKANRSDIAELTTDKVKYADIIDDLVTNVSNKPLSAAQGVVLKRLIDGLPALLGLKAEAIGNPNTPLYWDGKSFVAGEQKTVDETSWEYLSQCSEKIAAGEDPASFGLAVGDKKVVTLTTGEQVDFVILGFNHDDLADGSGKAGITFGMENLLSTPYDIFATLPSSYKGDMGDTLIPNVLVEIFATLPGDLKKCMKSITKMSYINGNAATTGTFYETLKLFLFSGVELGVVGVNKECGKKYDYYTKGTSTTPSPVKALGGVGAFDYVSREVFSSSSSESWFSLMRFSSNGRWQSERPVLGEASNQTGICFGFCI